ncbi:MAG TPA: DUF1643 domain-containing protein [Wenzhouxiangellaceae bacterium]|nr:DUF1643 domain-containing protein [Wenzhouxiangellaceae bacterium]
MHSGAHFSRCRRYRYALSRAWDADLPVVLMIGLNPSTADASKNDPTIRRCIGFANDWGFGGVWVLNLFAFRATYPSDLKAAADPVGPRNDEWIRRVARKVDRVVAVWGNDGGFMERSRRVRGMLGARFEVIRLNAGGEPAHPLYLPKGLKPVRWLGGEEKRPPS